MFDDEKKLVDASEVIKKELEELGLTGNGKALGIAVSGGGIRSASFSIGVLQALNACELIAGTDGKERLFEKFDYLSTVSGGGYMGTCLSWFRSRYGESFFPFGEKDSGDIELKQALSKEEEQSGTGDPEPQDILCFVRLHGKYLTPTVWLDFISAVGTVLRGMLVSAGFYFAFLTLFLAIVIGVAICIGEGWLAPEIARDNLDSVVSVAQKAVTAGQQWISDEATAGPYLAQTDQAVIALAALVTGAASGLFVLFAVFKAVIVPIFMGRTPEICKDYLWRRAIQRLNGLLLKTALAGILLLTLPIAFRILGGSSPYGIVIGLVAAFLRFRTAAGKAPVLSGAPGIGSSAMIVAAGLFIYVLLLYAYKCGIWFWGGNGWIAGESAWCSLALFGVLLLLTGILININYTALGRMYQDRLMEVFMPGVDAVNLNRWKPAKVADGFGLEALCKHKNKFVRPYHLINTNAVMINDKDMRLKGRGGTSFLLSPLYVGSDATRYADTRTYMQHDGVPKYTGLTAATAMAVSGAAANPNTGVGGEGKTRNPMISFLMTFFSIRLGYWGAHPGNKIFLRPNILYPGVPALLGLGFKSNRKFLDLSDGGHFENLGLYELIRRRCQFIIASDAGADKDFNFADLGNAVERVRVDFGVSIRFNISSAPGDGMDEDEEQPACEAATTEDYDLQHLLPGTAGNLEFMEKFALAKRGFALATIRYPADEDQHLPPEAGLLLYIKSTLTPALPADLYGYKAKHPQFPDQSTADQFFDEGQFEAYRELGYAIAKTALNDKTARRQIEQCTRIRFPNP